MPSRHERAFGLAVALGLFAAGSGSAAQISPGPLSKAHAELEGMRNCLECHGIGEPKLDGRCLACHGEIEWLRARGRGLHGAADLGECATCHTEHGGRDFEIVRWEAGRPEAFDHRDAGWPLEGRHRETGCRDCHQEKHMTSEAMRQRDRAVPADSWLGLETACAACHADPHDGRLGADCAQCHTTRNFGEIVEGRFDHESTRYPLRGAHRLVACAGCHEAEAGWVHRPESSACASCHADPHGGLATIAGRRADCAECHAVEGFRPSTFTVAMHATGPFPLEGEHRTVACEACHPSKEGVVALRPAHARCVNCHADPHGGQLAARADGGACESCHDVDRFSPSTFSVEDHGALGFRLAGRHAETACRSCHGPRRPFPLEEPVPTGRAAVLFRFADTRCGTCHADPHRGRFAAERCVACHDERGFAPSRVDAAMHATYAFPLEGAHAAIPCLDCHRELEREPLENTLVSVRSAAHLSFEIDRRECRDCHRDPHGGQFEGRSGGDACSVCHGFDSFADASRFDHERDAGFQLAGAHAAIACAACHRDEELAPGARGPRYRPVPSRCEDCHGGAKP
jgi:hypothetical protein